MPRSVPLVRRTALCLALLAALPAVGLAVLLERVHDRVGPVVRAHPQNPDPEAVGTRRLRLAVAAAHRAGPVALVGVPGRTVRPEVQPTQQTPASA